MKLYSKISWLKSLVVFLLFSFFVLVAAWVVKQKTEIKPRATLPKEDENSFFTIPSPLPKMNIGDGEDTIPTPICQIDADGCTSCCIKLDNKTICHDRACPAKQPFKVE